MMNTQNTEVMKKVSTSEEADEMENPFEELLEKEDAMEMLFSAHAKATGQRTY